MMLLQKADDGTEFILGCIQALVASMHGLGHVHS